VRVIAHPVQAAGAARAGWSLRLALRVLDGVSLAPQEMQGGWQRRLLLRGRLQLALLLLECTLVQRRLVRWLQRAG
jgi:hypothetical protein